MRVSNPTAKAKAVRASDGLATILPGGSVEIQTEWTEAETARYLAAGLVIDTPAPKGETVKRRVKKAPTQKET